MFAHKSYLVLDTREGADFLSLSKNGYELLDSQFNLQQDIDQKGQPTTAVHGGTISVVLPMIPPKPIVEWALNARMYKEGMIVVLDDHYIPQHKIMFETAACINMVMSYAQKGKSHASTTIVIQAEALRFGSNVNFLSNWVK